MSYRFIERSYLDRERPHGFARDVLKLTNNLCHNIPWMWISRARDEADVIIYPEEHVNGIAFIKFKKDYGYVDLICAAKGHGPNLLKIAENLAREKGKTRMILCSIKTPFGFYLKKGYKVIDRNCEWYDTVWGQYEVMERMPDGTFATKEVQGCGLPKDACVYMEKVFKSTMLPLDIITVEESKPRRAGPIRRKHTRMERKADPLSPPTSPTSPSSPINSPLRRSPRFAGKRNTRY